MPNADFEPNSWGGDLESSNLEWQRKEASRIGATTYKNNGSGACNRSEIMELASNANQV